MIMVGNSYMSNKDKKIKNISIVGSDSLKTVIERAQDLSKDSKCKVKFTFFGSTVIVDNRTSKALIRKTILRNYTKGNYGPGLAVDLTTNYKKEFELKDLKNRTRLSFSKKTFNIFKSVDIALDMCKESNIQVWFRLNGVDIILNRGDDRNKKILEYYDEVLNKNLSQEEKLERDNFKPYILKMETTKAKQQINLIKRRRKNNSIKFK